MGNTDSKENMMDIGEGSRHFDVSFTGFPEFRGSGARHCVSLQCQKNGKEVNWHEERCTKYTNTFRLIVYTIVLFIITRVLLDMLLLIIFYHMSVNFNILLNLNTAYICYQKKH